MSPNGTYMVESLGKLSTGTHNGLFVRTFALSDGKCAAGVCKRRYTCICSG